MIKKIYQINEHSLMCDFGDNINKKINSKVINFFNYIKNRKSFDKDFGIRNCVPSYNKLLIQYDLNKTNYDKVIDLINKISNYHLSEYSNNQLIELPICYEEEFALDLQDVASKNKLNIDEVINLHLSTEFYVYMIGFAPGFPFMGDLSNKLHTTRLVTPRISVPARSVAIVDKFCVIYPNESPGGWNILGKTPQQLFFKENNNPSLLQPGSLVKFYRISKNEFIKL